MTTLQKINALQYYDGLKAVKDVLKSIFSSITSLETNSAIVGQVTLVPTTLTSGTLEVGTPYIINTLNVGDDFSNVGYTQNNRYFIATGTTPTSWANGTTANGRNKTLRVDFNDVDINYTSKMVVFGASFSNELQFTITNGKFINPLKVFSTNVNVTVIDSNNIIIPSGRFKIEVYN